jgi:hypothetical protein
MTTDRYTGPERRDPDDFDSAVRGHISACAWKTFPFVMSGFIATFGWGVSIETRINNIQTIQAERTIKMAAVDVRLSDIAKAAYDPAPKPETKVAVEALRADHNSMMDKIDRLEDRVNNLHNFLLQLPPRPAPLPSRRGMAPFKPEEQG